MTSGKKRYISETIEQYSQTISSDGITVRTKCFRIVTGDRVRLEILLDAAGQRATVDVPISREERLPELMQQAAVGFAATLATRLDRGRL